MDTDTFTILTDEEREHLATVDEVGFLPDFVEWAGRKTDAPTYALKTAALMALSLACGDVVTLNSPFSSDPIYLNLYIMLVGPSTTMRKTTVLNYANGLLPDSPVDSSRYVYILDDVSTQAFNKVVAEASTKKLPVVLNVDEVAGLFETIKKKGSYLAGFDKTLMRCYDHTPVYVNRTNSSIEAPDGAFTNIFAASTPEPLMEVLGGEDIASGLLPRFLYFNIDGSARRPRRSLMDRMNDTDDWEAEQARLAEFLKNIAWDRVNPGNILGVDEDGKPIPPNTYDMTFIPIAQDALERLDAIDAIFTEEAWHDEAGWGAIKGRGFWHIVKLSALYAVSREGKAATVRLDDVYRAAHLVEILLEDMRLMSQDVGANETERALKAIIEYIERNPKGAQRQTDIAESLNLTAREAREYVKTLVVRGRITIEKNERGETIWKLV